MHYIHYNGGNVNVLLHIYIYIYLYIQWWYFLRDIFDTSPVANLLFEVNCEWMSSPKHRQNLPWRLSNCTFWLSPGNAKRWEGEAKGKARNKKMRLQRPQPKGLTKLVPKNKGRNLFPKRNGRERLLTSPIFRVFGILTHLVRGWARGVQSPPKCKVFRFHYHSQKVIGSLTHKNVGPLYILYPL